MKKLTIALVVLMLAFAASTFGQIQAPQIDAQKLYEQNAHQIMSPFSQRAALATNVAGSMHTMSLKRRMGGGDSSPIPGDNAKYVAMKLNREFLEYGDRLVVRLIGLESQGAFTIGGRVTYYDDIKQEATSRFFTPEVCGYRGFCPSGLAQYQNLVVHAEEVTSAVGLGEYQIDFCIFDANDGRLRQQVFGNYYVGRTSSFGRNIMYVDNVSVVPAPAPGLGKLLIKGRFPKEEKMVVWTGNVTEGYGSYNPSAVSGDGWFVSIDEPFVFGNGGDHPVDVIVCSPSWRMCTSLSRAYVSGSVMYPVPISQTK